MGWRNPLNFASKNSYGTEVNISSE